MSPAHLSFPSWSPPPWPWYCVTYIIMSDAVLRRACWSSHSLNTTQGTFLPLSCHGKVWTLIYCICLGTTWISFHLHVDQYQGFSTFFPPLRTCGINRFFFSFFFWLDSPTLILLLVRQSERGEKERWECQRGSTQQLKVINHCHDGEKRKMKDMRAGAQQQRWQESLCRDEMNQPIQRPEFCCWYEAATSLPEGLWVSKAATFWSKERRRECARLWPLNKIWIVHWITASLAAPKGPRYLMKTTKLWVNKMFRLERETQCWHVQNHRSEVREQVRGRIKP